MRTIESADSTEGIFPSGILEGPTSRRAFLRNLVAASLAFGSNARAEGVASTLSDPRSAGKQAGVPSLDELAGDWLPMSSLGSYPALSNFLGSLQATDDMVGVKHLTFPPFSQAQDSGTVRVNGRPLQATDSRWYAYQVLRRNRSAELEAESSVRMVHEERAVLFRLKLRNTQRAAQIPEVTAELAGLVGKYGSGWDWALPAPKDEDEFTATR